MKLIIGGRAQGKESFARESFPGDAERIIRDYHLTVRRQLEKGIDPIELADKLYSDKPDAIIITDELGMGVVPTDAFEREYREASGRVNIRLAQLSDEVYRVFCGIGQRIK